MNTEERRQELKAIIKSARKELMDMDKDMTWQEACEYMYSTLKKGKAMTVYNTRGGARYHGYEGMGILYSLHGISESPSRYRKA